MNRTRKLAAVLGWLTLATVVVFAQYRTAREAEAGGLGEPQWTVPQPFQRDVFTFVRIKYRVDGRYGWGHTRDRWMIDFPEADLNISYRLQQLTSLKVNPDGKVLELTDKELFDYPFIYIVEPGRLTFTEEEVPILRNYLLNGGFLMVDDFWGEAEWDNFTENSGSFFPTVRPLNFRSTTRFSTSIFDLKERPQIPGEPHWRTFVATGKTWEKSAQRGPLQGIYDDAGG